MASSLYSSNEFSIELLVLLLETVINTLCIRFLSKFLECFYFESQCRFAHSVKREKHVGQYDNLSGFIIRFYDRKQFLDDPDEKFVMVNFDIAKPFVMYKSRQ